MVLYASFSSTRPEASGTSAYLAEHPTQLRAQNLLSSVFLTLKIQRQHLCHRIHCTVHSRRELPLKWWFLLHWRNWKLWTSDGSGLSCQCAPLLLVCSSHSHSLFLPPRSGHHPLSPLLRTTLWSQTSPLSTHPQLIHSSHLSHLKHSPQPTPSPFRASSLSTGACSTSSPATSFSCLILQREGNDGELGGVWEVKIFVFLVCEIYTRRSTYVHSATTLQAKT